MVDFAAAARRTVYLSNNDLRCTFCKIVFRLACGVTIRIYTVMAKVLGYLGVHCHLEAQHILHVATNQSCVVATNQTCVGATTSL